MSCPSPHGAGLPDAPVPFEPLVKQVENVNFLLHTDYQDRTTGAGDLLPIGLEKHEAQSDSRADAVKRAYRPYRWQRQIDFSMEILVNDELGYFNDQAQRFGQAARRTLERYVTNMMTNATTLARLAGLGAMYTTTGRLTSDRISVAEMAFSRRTDSLGNPISVSPKYLVHHKSLANVVRTIRASQLVPETATNAANIVANDLTATSVTRTFRSRALESTTCRGWSSRMRTALRTWFLRACPASGSPVRSCSASGQTWR